MNRSRAFTLVETAAVCAAGALLVPLAVGFLGGQPDSARETARRIKDSQQVRGIHQGMVVWAQNNKDWYPLPSKIDKDDFTVIADEDRAKDTTSHIYSLMVFNGTVSTEIYISPVETNTNIKVYDDYEFDMPKKAATPAKALWDPAFSVDFTAAKVGGASYAHLQPSAGRLKRFSNTFSSSERMISMRGPEIAKVDKNEDGSVTPTLANLKSLTLGMYEISPSTWSGNVVFNDNAVKFQSKVLASGKAIAKDPKGPKYKSTDGKEWPDIWCYNEPDDSEDRNDFLGIFTKAGDATADFKPIWD